MGPSRTGGRCRRPALEARWPWPRRIGRGPVHARPAPSTCAVAAPAHMTGTRGPGSPGAPSTEGRSLPWPTSASRTARSGASWAGASWEGLAQPSRRVVLVRGPGRRRRSRGGHVEETDLVGETHAVAASPGGDPAGSGQCGLLPGELHVLLREDADPVLEVVHTEGTLGEQGVQRDEAEDHRPHQNRGEDQEPGPASPGSVDAGRGTRGGGSRGRAPPGGRGPPGGGPCPARGNGRRDIGGYRAGGQGPSRLAHAAAPRGPG